MAGPVSAAWQRCAPASQEGRSWFVRPVSSAKDLQNPSEQRLWPAPCEARPSIPYCQPFTVR